MAQANMKMFSTCLLNGVMSINEGNYTLGNRKSLEFWCSTKP